MNRFYNARLATLGAALAVGLAAGIAISTAKDEGAVKAGPAEKITGIGGVFFKSKDPKATAAWYSKNLGVSLEADATFGFFFWKDLDHPERTARTVWTSFPADTDYFQPGASEFMVNYRVRDLDAMLAQLRAGGVQIVGKTLDEPYGRFAWIMDPDGRKVELWQPLGE